MPAFSCRVTGLNVAVLGGPLELLILLWSFSSGLIPSDLKISMSVAQTTRLWEAEVDTRGAHRSTVPWQAQCSWWGTMP